MNDFKRVNELVAESKKNLNALYDIKDSEILNSCYKICGFKGGAGERIAVLRRIVDLKTDPLINECKKLGFSEEQILNVRDKMYNFVRKMHEKMHEELIEKIASENILDEFYMQILRSTHRIGQILSKAQFSWQKKIIDENGKKFSRDFDSIAEAKDFINKHKLYQKTAHGEICDRSYGVVNEINGKILFLPYALAFETEFKELDAAFEDCIKSLRELALNREQEAYIVYFEKLRAAFGEKENENVISAWRDAEIAWMDVKTPLQIGHPLEYYEDVYTHAVALEWDIRLARQSEFNVGEFKKNAKETFDKFYKKIGADNEIMHAFVDTNIDKTQLYISTPMIYYAADFNGLFSAQVVPNDEFVSSNCGKKIFAFVDFVYESAKSKPFMRLTSEIFDLEYLNFGREILFNHPEIWRKVYEISTIGHEFGHIFFIDEDTEALMNKSGVFKFIEEYKATTGGLMNFFMHENKKYALPVLDELIRRSVGLIAWQKVDDVRAYYCEGLIHLSLLFKSGVLNFENNRLIVDLSENSYENFRRECIKNYENLAKIYVDKCDANEFLSKFCVLENGVYLPLDASVREFVKFYYSRFELIGNEIDESGEREKWNKK